MSKIACTQNVSRRGNARIWRINIRLNTNKIENDQKTEETRIGKKKTTIFPPLHQLNPEYGREKYDTGFLIGTIFPVVKVVKSRRK